MTRRTVVQKNSQGWCPKSPKCFKGTTRETLEFQDHTHKKKKRKKMSHAPCPKSSSYASWRDLSDKDTQQKSIIVSTQRKYHDISQALSVAFKNLSVLIDTEFWG